MKCGNKRASGIKRFMYYPDAPANFKISLKGRNYFLRKWEQ